MEPSERENQALLSVLDTVVLLFPVWNISREKAAAAAAFFPGLLVETSTL